MKYNEAATRYAELKAQADALAAEMADLAQELRAYPFERCFDAALELNQALADLRAIVTSTITQPADAGDNAAWLKRAEWLESILAVVAEAGRMAASE